MESKEFHPTGMATEEESEASKDVRNGKLILFMFFVAYSPQMAANIVLD